MGESVAPGRPSQKYLLRASLVSLRTGVTTVMRSYLGAQSCMRPEAQHGQPRRLGFGSSPEPDLCSKPRPNAREAATSPAVMPSAPSCPCTGWRDDRQMLFALFVRRSPPCHWPCLIGRVRAARVHAIKQSPAQSICLHAAKLVPGCVQTVNS